MHQLHPGDDPALVTTHTALHQKHHHDCFLLSLITVWFIGKICWHRWRWSSTTEMRLSSLAGADGGRTHIQSYWPLWMSMRSGWQGLWANSCCVSNEERFLPLSSTHMLWCREMNLNFSQPEGRSCSESSGTAVDTCVSSSKWQQYERTLAGMAIVF